MGCSRRSLTTAQQLSRWFGTRDKLVLEPAGSNGDALDAASDNIELVFFFDAHEMIRAWRAAGAAAFDSCVLGGQAADARFNAKAFAKLLGTSEAKVDAALGRQEYAPAPAVATAAIVPFIDAPISLDVVLLRAVEAKVVQLRANSFASLGAELDAVLAPKKRATAAAAAENIPPVAGTLQPLCPLCLVTLPPPTILSADYSVRMCGRPAGRACDGDSCRTQGQEVAHLLQRARQVLPLHRRLSADQPLEGSARCGGEDGH